jgi:tocopherol cyclase
MGPGDGYILQYARTPAPFWANKDALELGACFKSSGSTVPKGMLPRDTFSSSVLQGFQASATLHQGSITAQEAGAPGQPLSTVDNCSWDFTVQPMYGWGGQNTRQKPTAGWLSVLSVFEPHWQVLMAHGLASGWFQWGGKRYEFTSAPTYAEKNWGGGFPSKWCWIQCNTFAGQQNLSVTAVGARRGLLGVPGVEEDVGMIGVHWNGTFIELVPWNGQVTWSADPWGRWWIKARSGTYEALIEATCSSEGAVLRAPTADQGLAPMCKDTFEGFCRLQLWEVSPAGAKRLLVDATSSSAALEVGGGPWWGPWRSCADMKEPFKSLVQLPLDVQALSSLLPQQLRPPGL